MQLVCIKAGEWVSSGSGRGYKENGERWSEQSAKDGRDIGRRKSSERVLRTNNGVVGTYRERLKNSNQQSENTVSRHTVAFSNMKSLNVCQPA